MTSDNQLYDNDEIDHGRPRYFTQHGLHLTLKP